MGGMFSRRSYAVSDNKAEQSPLLRASKFESRNTLNTSEPDYTPIRALFYEFIEATPPATSATQKYGILFDLFTIFLILVNTLTFVLSTEASVPQLKVNCVTTSAFSNECWTEWKWGFEIVEWVTVVLFTLEYIARVYARGQVGGNKARVRFIFSFWSFIDLICILPFFVDRFVEEDLPPFQWVRTMKILQSMHQYGRFTVAMNSIHAVFSEKGRLLATASFLGLTVWVIMSALNYVAERDNPVMLLTCTTEGDDYVLNRFGNIPSSSFYTLVNLFGEFPLMTYHSPLGMVIGTFIAIFAVAVFAIPTGIIASAFQDQLEQRQTARKEAAFKSAQKKWKAAVALVMKRTDVQVVNAFGFAKENDYVVVHASQSTDVVGDESTWCGKLYNFLNAKTKAGKVFEKAMFVLIALNVVSFMVGTVKAVKEQGLIDEEKGALWIVEAVSVAIFTLELVFRFSVAGVDPQHSGVTGRLRWLLTFYVLVDLGAILPFYIDLATPGDLPGTTFIRALRMIRVLTIYETEFTACSDVIAANADILKVTGIFASVLWLYFSVFMWLAERNNPCIEVAEYYKSVPDSMWITLLNLSGEIPLADYTPIGKVLIAFIEVFAVGLFGIPVAVLSSGFEELAMEQAEERAQQQSKDLNAGKSDTKTHTNTHTASSNDVVKFESLSALTGSHSPRPSSISEIPMRERVHTLLLHNVWFERVTALLIAISSVLAIIETVASIANITSVMRAFDGVEGVCVVYFTVEWIARVYVSPEMIGLDWYSDRSGTLARLRYIVTFYSLVDLVAIVPWYLSLARVQWAIDSENLLRMTRILRLLTLSSMQSSLSLLGAVFKSKAAVLKVTTGISLVFWVVFSTLLYLTEQDNEEEDADMVMRDRFDNVPNSLQYVAIFLSGDYPLINFTFWGRIINFANVLIAVGVVGIPASILVGGFTELLEERRALRTANSTSKSKSKSKSNHGIGKILANKTNDDNNNTTTTANTTNTTTTSTTTVATNTTPTTIDSTHANAYTNNEEHDDDDDDEEDVEIENQHSSLSGFTGYTAPQPTAMFFSTRARVHLFLAGETAWGGRCRIALFILIVLNAVAVVVESVDEVFDAAPSFWRTFEVISVVLFTIEYVLRVFSATHDRRVEFSRAVYMTSFFGVVDLLGVLPFYIQEIVQAVNGNSDESAAAVFRVLRLFRLFHLENFMEAISLLDDVYRECREILYGTGIVALVMWVGGAVLFQISNTDKIENVPVSLYYTAVFLGGDWALCDFSVAGKVLCVFYCAFGIALYGTCIGFLGDAFSQVLEAKTAKARS